MEKSRIPKRYVDALKSDYDRIEISRGYRLWS